MSTKKVRFVVQANVPQDVKDYRLGNALRDAVVRHVVPDYDRFVPHVVVSIGECEDCEARRKAR